MSMLVAENPPLDQIFPDIPIDPEMLADILEHPGYYAEKSRHTVPLEDEHMDETKTLSPLITDEERKDQVLDWFLNGTPVGEGIDSTHIRKVMSFLGGTEFLEDPAVMARFELVRDGLKVNSSDIDRKPNTISVSAVDIGSASRPYWYGKAACSGFGEAQTKKYFPKQGSGLKEAIAICNECPVENICLAENIDDPNGIWGGTSQRSRKRIHKMLINDKASIAQVVAAILKDRSHYANGIPQLDEEGDLKWYMSQARKELKEKAEKERLAEEAKAEAEALGLYVESED